MVYAYIISGEFRGGSSGAKEPPFAKNVKISDSSLNKRFEFKKLMGRLRPWKLESLGIGVID